MKRQLPPLNWLRTFEAAARHLSFTGAGRDLNMTQSAVSQQIKSLEGYLGRPLFFRRARALELTQTGLSYLPVVRDAFRTLTHGTRAITRTTTDVLRVQCNLTFAIHWLAPRLSAFRAPHPDVQLDISTELWEPRDIAEGVDIEIRYSLRPSDTVPAEILHRDFYYPFRTEVDLTAAQRRAIGELVVDLQKTVAEHQWQMQEAYFLIQSPQAQTLPGAKAFVTWLRAELARFQSGRLGTQA